MKLADKLSHVIHAAKHSPFEKNAVGEVKGSLIKQHCHLALDGTTLLVLGGDTFQSKAGPPDSASEGVDASRSDTSHTPSTPFDP